MITDQHIQNLRWLGRTCYLALGQKLLLNPLDHRTGPAVGNTSIPGVCGFDGKSREHLAVEAKERRAQRFGLIDRTFMFGDKQTQYFFLGRRKSPTRSMRKKCRQV